jgi:hypothetical protein
MAVSKTEVLLFIIAKSIKDKSSLFFKNCAPDSSKYSTTFEWPDFAAKCSGVFLKKILRELKHKVKFSEASYSIFIKRI